MTLTVNNLHHAWTCSSLSQGLTSSRANKSSIWVVKRKNVPAGDGVSCFTLAPEESPALSVFHDFDGRPLSFQIPSHDVAGTCADRLWHPFHSRHRRRHAADHRDKTEPPQSLAVCRLRLMRLSLLQTAVTDLHTGYRSVWAPFFEHRSVFHRA